MTVLLAAHLYNELLTSSFSCCFFFFPEPSPEREFSTFFLVVPKARVFKDLSFLEVLASSSEEMCWKRINLTATHCHFHGCDCAWEPGPSSQCSGRERAGPAARQGLQSFSRRWQVDSSPSWLGCARGCVREAGAGLGSPDQRCSSSRCSRQEVAHVQIPNHLLLSGLWQLMASELWSEEAFVLFCVTVSVNLLHTEVGLSRGFGNTLVPCPKWWRCH